MDLFLHIDGKEQLFNLLCNGGVFNLGHRNPEITDVLRSVLDDLDIENNHLMSKERDEIAVQQYRLH